MARKGSLGNWQIKREGENQLLVTLPEGMVLSGKRVKIEDLLDAIQKHKVLKAGTKGDGVVTVKCCSGNTAIA
jgi:hypothetical protein